MIVNLDHIVLNVRDVDASIDFYTNILGFSVERLDAYRQGSVPFPSVRINNDTLIDLFPPKMWQADASSSIRSQNLNHFCIALSLADWESLRERLGAKKIAISKDRSINFGAHGDGISMYFHDPDGNEIEARYYENE